MGAKLNLAEEQLDYYEKEEIVEIAIKKKKGKELWEKQQLNLKTKAEIKKRKVHRFWPEPL